MTTWNIRFREATKSYIRGTWVWTLNSAIYLNQEKSVSSVVIMASSVVIMESKRIAWCSQPRGPQLPFSQWRNSVVMLLIVGFTSLTFFVFTKHLSKVIQFIQRSKFFAYFWMVELTSANKANWTAWLKFPLSNKLWHILTDAFLWRMPTEKVVNYLRAELVKRFYTAANILDRRRLIYTPELFIHWSLCQRDEDYSTLCFCSVPFFDVSWGHHT